jgi:predicted anti-sigma-YlaC factor YlaD
MTAHPLRCREVVELVTDQLEGALAPRVHAAVGYHLRGCDGCAAYVEQVRATVRAVLALGSTPSRPLDPRVRDRLLTAYRTWSAEHRAQA